MFIVYIHIFAIQFTLMLAFTSKRLSENPILIRHLYTHLYIYIRFQSKTKKHL